MTDVAITPVGTVATGTVTTGAVSVASDSGTLAGHYLLCMASIDFVTPGSNTNPGITAVTGVDAWTEIAVPRDPTGTGTTMSARVWLARVNTNGAKTVPFTGTSGSRLICQVHTLNPGSGATITVDGVSTITDRTSPFTHTSVTPAGTLDLLYAFYVAYGGGPTLTADAAMTEAVQIPYGSTTQQTCRQQLSAAGATGTRSQTANGAYTGGAGCGALIALRSQTSSTDYAAAVALSGTDTLTVGATPGRPAAVALTGADTLTVGATVVAVYAQPSLVDTYTAEAASSPTTMTTDPFTPRQNELIVVKVVAGDETTVLGAPTGGGLTWTDRGSSNATNYTPTRMFTATVGASPSEMTVSVSTTGSQASSPTLIVERWADAQLAATPAGVIATGTTTTGTPAGTPSATITPTDAGSRLTWVAGDWTPAVGATVTYRGTATENYRRRDSNLNVFSAWQAAGATSAQTIGLTAPTAQKWTMIGLEIQPGPAPIGTGAQSAAAALSGADTLTVAALQVHQGAQPVAGFDTLTVGATRYAQVAAALTAASTLTVGAARTAQVAAPLAGTDTLTAGADRTALVAAPLTGTDTLAVAPWQAQSGAATLTGTDTLIVGALRTALVAAALAGTDTLTTATRQTQLAAVALTGVDTLSSVFGGSASAALSGVDTLTVAVTSHGWAAAAALTGADTLTVAAWQTQRAAVALTGADTLTTAGTRVHPAAVALTAADTLLAGGTRVKIGAVALSATDTLSIGYILRTAVVAAALTGTDTLTATAKVAAGGGLNISAWAVDRQQGGRLVPLPGVVSGDVSDIANDAGAVTISHLRDGSRGDLLLRRDVGDDSDLEVEIWLGGRRSTALRGYLEDVAGDDVAENGVATYTGRLMLMRLEQAVIAPQPADEKKEYRVAAATPGAMALQLLAQAQARGVLTDITTDFTATLDSDGAPWPELFTGTWSPGTTYLEWVQSLVDLVLCETELTAAKVWRLFVFGGRGTSLTSGLRPVTLRRGLNLGEAGRRATVRGAGTDFLVAGGEGIYRTEVVPNARTRRGRAVEVSSSVGNIDQPDAVTSAAQRVAASGTSGAEERSFALALTAGQPRPVQTFSVGDTLRVDTDGSLTSERVAQWQLSWDPSSLTGSATTGDLIRSRMAGLLKRLTAVGSGTAIIGTSEPTEDTGIPLAPTGLVVGSAAFVEGQDVYASVTAGWLAVQSNTDGTAATDLDRYRVEWCLESNPDVWYPGAEVAHPDTDASWTVAPNLPIRVRVQAIDRSGNRSAWSPYVLHLTEDDATPPPVASAPVVENWMGALRIRWDGNTAAGLDERAAAPDFTYVELHLSTASNFNPDTRAWPVGTLVTNLYAGGTWTMGSLPIGVTQYARLVAVDLRGNRSGPSVQGSAAPRQLLGPEIFDGAVGSAKLADLAVVRAKIDDLAVNNAKMADLSVAKLTGGVATFDVTLAGVIRTALTGSRTELDNAGLRLYDSANQIRVNLATATGDALVTGEYRTALAGARLVMNPGGASPAEVRFYPSSTNQYARMKTLTSVSPVYPNQAGITMKGYSPITSGATLGMSGEVSVFPGYARLAWSNEMDGGGISSSIGAEKHQVGMGGPRIQIGAQSGTDEAEDSLIRIGVLNNAGTTFVPIATGQWDNGGAYGYGRWLVPGSNCGWQYNNANPYNSISAINNVNNLIVVFASAFLTSSDKTLKSKIERDPFDAMAAVRKAPFYRYELDDGKVDKAGKARPSKEVGLMAEELPPDLVTLDHNGKQAVNVYGVTAVLWGALQGALARIEQLERRPPR